VNCETIFSFEHYYLNCQEELLLFKMQFLVKIILLVCLCCELKCLEIKKCDHTGKKFTWPQSTQILVGCETDKGLLECTLKKNDNPDQSCTFQYKQYFASWTWEVKSCSINNIISTSNNYKHCQFSLTTISSSGKKAHL
jgi:hypothetical protein